MLLNRILNLPTPRLLKYFQKHYRDRRGSMEYHCDEYGDVTHEELHDFMIEYNMVKEELDSREHVTA